MAYVWKILPAQSQVAQRLADDASVHPITAQLLLNRGISTARKVRRFLNPSLADLTNPFELPDMELAVKRMKLAVKEHQAIVIFGDSDVDGLTATTILYEALGRLGGHVSVLLANRLEGYGISSDKISQLCRSKTKLVVLVDCGTNQPEAVNQLANAGIDTIIIDHHLPMDEWAQSYALVNPFRNGERGRELCSAGLAFKVIQGLFGVKEYEQLFDFLDLAALGTLADCSPLKGDSRLMVTEGLPRIVQSHRVGLRRLCAETKTLRAHPDHILRKLTPRLNACGRLGKPAATWNLLREDANGKADELLAETGAAHSETKQLLKRALDQAGELVRRLHFRDEYVLVVAGSDWHQGVMGPVASRLAQSFGRPAIVIAKGERYGVGSGRSIPMFNLLKIVKSCESMLMRFGGHAQACGITLEVKHIDRFRDAINSSAKERLSREVLIKTKTVDLEISLTEIKSDWVAETEAFAPFGFGNPKPVLAVRDVRIRSKSPRTGFINDGRLEFAVKGSLQTVNSQGRYDVLVSPAVVKGELVLTLSDVKVSQGDVERDLSEDMQYKHEFV